MTILGHVLRGGTPTAYDRVLATRFGVEAVDAVEDRAFGVMVALHGTEIVRVPIDDAVQRAQDRRPRVAATSRPSSSADGDIGHRAPQVRSARMGSTLDDLVDMLDLERLEVNLFRGVSLEEGRSACSAGRSLAQALVAAGRTVEAEIPVHSLHAYFLRPGDPDMPIVFDVDRIRDGRSFTTRRVVAIQHGNAIFNLAASFQVVEEGPEHSDPMPDVPGPEGLTPMGRPPWVARVHEPEPVRLRARAPDRDALRR